MAQLGGPGVTNAGLPRSRGPATAATRRVPYPDIPNDLWLLLDGPTIPNPPARTPLSESAPRVGKSRHQGDELTPLGGRQRSQELFLDAVEDVVELEKPFGAFCCDRDDVPSLVLRID